MRHHWLGVSRGDCVHRDVLSLECVARHVTNRVPADTLPLMCVCDREQSWSSFEFRICISGGCCVTAAGRVSRDHGAGCDFDARTRLS